MRKLLVLGFALTVTAAALGAGAVLGPSPTESAFPGANGKIAFTSDRDGNYEIYAMNPDGSGQTNLSNNPAYDVWPAWSPDGTKIAFGRRILNVEPWGFEIIVMNADGSGQTNVTNSGLSGVWNIDPAWSPDGSKIAFGRSVLGGDGEVYVINPDGSGETNLTNNPGASEGDPTWSPDGSKIAYMGLAGVTNPEIFVMNADGSNKTRLTFTANFITDAYPAWSPDGTKITFTSDRDAPGPGEIYVMNADGSSPTNLSNNPAWDGLPAWSPDGTKIAFMSGRDGNAEIYVMNADGSSPTNLSNNPASDAYPDWQPLVVYGFSGFFRPVDNPPVLNSVKAGSGVPVKFSLGGDEGLSIFATGYPKSQKITCDTSAPLDAIEETVTAGSSSLSYDPVADQYVYVWKTDKAWAGTCRQLMVRLDDLTDHVANFKFK